MNEPVNKQEGASQPANRSPARLAQRGSYGVDAPVVPLMLAGIGAIGLVLGVLNLAVWHSIPWAIVGFVYATCAATKARSISAVDAAQCC